MHRRPNEKAANKREELKVVDERNWVRGYGGEVVYWPSNAWAQGRYFKQVGAFSQQDLLKGMESMSLKVISCLG